MIRHVSGLAEIVDDVAGAVRFYRDLGLEAEYTEGEPYAAVHAPGILHLGVWDRALAAERIFGDRDRVEDVPRGFILGFEVDDPEAAAAGVSGAGTILQQPQTEPWGQETARFLTPGGALCEFTRTPWARTLRSGPIAEPPASG